MIDKLQLEFTEYAKNHYPREACALAVIVKGKLKLFKCENLSSNNDQFRMSSNDWIKAEELGEIVGLLHSHPDTSSEPSEADRVACESTNIPWYILSLVDDSWTTLKPKRFTPPLYGRTFYHGIIDCYSLVRDWYKLERGIELKNFVRDDQWWESGQNLYVDNFRLAGFYEVPRINGDLDFSNVLIGDVLLMQIQSNVSNHAAIYLGDGLIAHHLYGRLSSRDIFGGIYQKHTSHILRFGNEKN